MATQDRQVDMISKSNHKWRFIRAGGFDQVKLASGEDLVHLASLDQKLWVALACPTSGLDLDARTLALIDTDKDGRIRVSELLTAVKFACDSLKRPDDLLTGASELPLSAINDTTAEGRTLLAAAKQVLTNLGRAGATSVTPLDFADPAKLFADTLFNGDGVVIRESADDDATRQIIDEIVASVGSELDRSGKQGVGPVRIAAFFEEAREHDAWFKEGESDARVLFLGLERTVAAAAALEAARAKVDDYFTRCRVAAFDPRTLPVLNRKEEDYATPLAEDLSASGEELAEFPVAQAAPNRPLTLSDELNPAHAAAIAALRRDTVAPVLGDRAILTEAEWRKLQERLAPCVAWRACQRGTSVAALGIARVRAILAAGAEATLASLVARDKALEPEVTAIDNVERLVLYMRDLFKLCTNFVSFKDFYDGGEPAIFQVGTLYLDQRACMLCLPVEDAGRHAAMAGLSGAYLAYVDCSRRATNEKTQIVAAFTAGDSDNLMIGRNGVFYDRKGRDWDGTITKIIDNPISVRQAFFSPYKKFARFVEAQIAKRAATAEGETHKQLDATAAAAANIDRTPPAPKPPAKMDIGTVAALGVAFGAIGSFLTAIVGYATGVFKLGVLATMGAVLAVILAISLPSVVLAYLKLRKRNLGPILDANGWAINTRARINVPFGTTLTAVAKLPPGARRDVHDRYAEKGFPWKRIVVLLAALYLAWSWYEGGLDRHLPEQLRSTHVLGTWAPRVAEPPVPAPVPVP
jgi:hypothetical protein